MKLQRAFFLVIALVFLVGFTVTVSNGTGSSQRAQVSGVSAQSIRSFNLVNADTDTIVGEITDGEVIDLNAIGTTHLNIVANTTPATVGSVSFKLDSLARVVRSSAPYSLGTQSGGNFSPASGLVAGDHVLVAQPFTRSRALGIAGESSTVRFSIVGGASATTNNNTNNTQTLTNPDTHPTAVPITDNIATTTASGQQEVTSFTLVNADTNQDIRTIENGSTITLAEIGTENITIRANATPTTVGSVKFYTNSASPRTDNLFEYTLNASSSSDDYLPWTYTLNQPYAITATPYTLSRARGTAGVPLTVNFTIVGGYAPVSGQTQNPTSGNIMVTTLPAMGCLTATVTNSSNSGDSANPGSITVSWNALSGYSKYKVWRIRDGNVVDSVENTGTAYTTNYVTPGTWSMRVAFLDPAAALNSNGNWGPEATIGNLVVGLGLGQTTSSTCSSGTTTDASITVPTANYVLAGQPFTFTAEGTPTNSQITSVSFKALSVGIGTIYPNVVDFGVDSQPPFTVQANIPVKGVYNLTARVTLSNGQVLIRRKQVYVTDYAVTNNTGTPTFNVTNAGFENQISANLTEDVPYTINYTTTVPSGVQFMGAEVRAWGGDPSWPGTQGWNGSGLTPLLATIPASAPSGSFQVTIPEPGTGVGAPPITNILVITSYFSNIVNTDNYRLMVASNPNEGQSSISNIQILKANGTNVTTLTSGMQVNIGTQNGGWGPAIAFRANTNPATVGSVKFVTDNGTPFIENTAPYSAFGDTNGTTYNTWPSLSVGAHSIVATPYSGPNATGVMGSPSTINFVVVNNDTPPPSMPTGLSVTYRSGNQIRLAWTAVSGATSYNVTRSGTSTGIFNTTSASYSDVNNTPALVSNGTYSYQVSAVGVGGESGLTTAVTSPTLSNTYTVGAAVYSPSGATARTLPENVAPNQSVTSTNFGTITAGPVWITGNTQYWQVQYTNPSILGWVAQTSLSPYVAQTAPLAPTNFTGSGASTSQINLTWNDIATNETGYEMQRAASTDTSFATPTTTTYGPGANSASITTGLSAGTPYLFRLRAVNSASGLNSAWVNSVPASISTQAAPTAPNPPTNLTGTASSTSTINLSWNSSNVTNETGFEVQRAASTDPNFNSPTAVTPNPGVDATTASSTGLAANTGYYFRVRAVNAAGNSAWATSALITTQNTQTGSQEDVACVPPNYANIYTAPESTWGISSYTGGTNKSVQLSSGYSTMNSTDPFIRLCWTTIPGRTVTSNITIKRREIADTNASWTTLTSSLAGTSTSYENHGVSLGVAYEYSVSFNQNSNAQYINGGGNVAGTYQTSGQADGYIATGIRAALPAYNGRLILVVDNSMANGTNGSAPTSGSLAANINTLINDLNGDRWLVYPIYVSRSETPANVRNLILAQYNADTTNTKAVYIVGHVPVALLSSLNPDGHGGRAMSSDLYYADMNETWSQSGCTLGSPYGATFASGEWSSSKMFCKTDVTPELQVGRIDMSNFDGGNETSLLQGYLDRMHTMKTNGLTPATSESAVMVAVYGFDDNATGASAQESAKKLVTRDFWNDVPGLVGNNILRHLGANFVTSNNMFAFYGLNDSGSCAQTNGTSGNVSWSTISANSSGWTNVFTSFSPSYLGEWNCNNSLLRAVLTKGRGANSWYHISRHTYLHHMGMGRNIGFSFRKTVAENNGATSYSPVAGWATDYTPATNNGYQSLMGDPTIRMTYVNMPGALTVTGTAGNPATFTWGAATGSPDGYNIYKFSSTGITRIATQVTGTSYVGDTFASGTKYMVTAVKNKTSAGGAKYWNESLGSIYTTTGGGGGDVLAPSAPSNLTVTGTTANSASLSWTASVGNPVGESVTYKVLRSTSTNGTYTQTGSNTTSTTFTDPGLTAGNTYYYRVTASDAASNTSAPAPSATTGVAATPADTQAPSAPAGLMSTAQTSSSITLTWNASTGNPVGETVNYKVFRSATANGTYTQTGSSTTNTTFTDSTGLVAGTTYYYKVSATDAANNASAQTPSSGYGIATSPLADTQPPTVPGGLQVTGTTSSSVSLSWNPSTDVGGSQVQGYLIYRSTTANGTYSSIGNTGGTSYTDSSGLSPSTTYYYKISAIDNSANGNESAQTSYVSGTTTAGSGGGSGQVLGLMGVYAGPNNTEDITPGANPAGAVDFYVDCVAGDDTRAGTSPATAWKTMDKFNSSGANQMVPGSRAFFKRGCRFYKTDVAPMPADQAGILSVSRSGSSSNYIEYKAYGTGTAPVISGAIPVTGWTQHAGSIYKANIGANKNVRFLFANDVDQTIARTPNRATDGSNVYMRTDSITGNTNATLTVSDSSSTDGSLPSSGTLNLTGGEYSARFLNWSYVVAPISAHSGQTITVSFPTGTNLPCYYPDCTNSVYPKAGWGYFVQNKLALLDTAGEWYYDNATGFVYFWAPGGVNPNSMTVEAAVHRNGVKLYGNIHHVKIKNLVFEKFNKFTYGGADKGAAVFIQDWTGASGSINNIIENVEIKNTPIAVRVESDVSNASNGNKILNSYIHDIYDIGIISYGIGHLFQGNVIENVALDPTKFGDGEEWNKAYAIVSTGGNSDTISNVIRNIGYIGVNYVGNGEIRGNLVENASVTINDGCGFCVDGALNDLVVKRNVVNHVFGNTVGLPPTFIHNTPLGSGISTGDRNSIGGIFTENVVNDFGNSGMTFDNNMLSDNMTMSDNTIYTAQQGNERGARGISMYDQSVGVYHPGENNSVAGFDYTFNHKIHGNKVYTLHSKNISLSEVTINGNNGTVADYGDYWGNYFFHPYTQSSIMLDRRSIQFKTGDYVWAKDATVPVFTTATGQTQVSGSPVAQHTKGYISGSESNYRWFVTFNGSAPDGWVDSWRIEQALRTPAEFDTIGGYPPAGQPGNTGPTYTTTNMPLLYVNTTGLPMNANIGSGKCGSNGQALANPYPLNAFADAIVPEYCSDQQ